MYSISIITRPGLCSGVSNACMWIYVCSIVYIAMNYYYYYKTVGYKHIGFGNTLNFD